MTLRINSKLEDWTFTAKVERLAFNGRWIKAEEITEDGSRNPLEIKLDHMNYTYEITED